MAKSKRFTGHFDEAIEMLLEEGRVRGLSEGTQRLRHLFLERFADWCAARHVSDVRSVTLDHVLKFRSSLDSRKGPGGRPLGTNYKNSHIRTVRMLLRLLFERNLILVDVAVQIPEYRQVKALPRGILTAEEVMRLLRSAHMTTPTGFRDRTMFEVLYSTGLRGGELCKLTLYDLDLPDRTLRVLQGKGKKDRVVPIGKVARGYLAEYIKEVRPVLLREKQSSALFVTARGTPIKTTNLRQQFQLHRDRAGLPDTIGVHSLRHTCATELLKGGASIRHVQELLGHASIQTTQVYTHVVQSDLKAAHARTAPSERRRSVDVPTFSGERPSWNDNRNAKYWPSVRGPAAMKQAREKARKKRRKK